MEPTWNSNKFINIHFWYLAKNERKGPPVLISSNSSIRIEVWRLYCVDGTVDIMCGIVKTDGSVETVGQILSQHLHLNAPPNVFQQ